MYIQFPALKKQEPRWEILYAEKKQNFIKFLNEGTVQLMPGAKEFILALKEADLKRCVVTHSPLELISLIRKQNPVLDTIPYWITREDYNHPKPQPECYMKAIELFATPEDRVIGFEDTPRGITALLPTRAKPVMISSMSYPEIPQLLKQGMSHYSSFFQFMDNKPQ
jgi:HAD superfamily hydrolase (TIGR01509 family)